MDDLVAINKCIAQEKNIREHPADCICHGKGYHASMTGPVPCGHQLKLSEARK